MRGAVVVLVLGAACGTRVTVVDATGDDARPCQEETDCSGSAPYCSPASNTCVACRLSSQCDNAICESDACRPARSCKELNTARPGLPSGAYTVDPDGPETAAPREVWCDMTTDGGGWTALLNPVFGSLPPSSLDLVTTVNVLSGTQSCGPTVGEAIMANGWHGIRSYACGSVTFSLSLSWENTLAATDVMFVAALQGEAVRTLSVEGAVLSPNATSLDPGNATCAFYNASGQTAALGLNTCWTTVVDTPPRIERDAIVGDLSIELTTGPACAPSCEHGTGMNVYRLFVR
ncbi:MAG: fibrinogen-like YCDxxxxGGGW domain-containing protein [Kofleriaceae bacterium]